MYCNNCGVELKDDAKFCYNCGQKVAITVDYENSMRVSPAPLTSKHKIRNIIMGVTIFAIILCCTIGYYINLPRKIGFDAFANSIIEKSTSSFTSDIVDRYYVRTTINGNIYRISYIAWGDGPVIYFDTDFKNKENCGIAIYSDYKCSFNTWKTLHDGDLMFMTTSKPNEPERLFDSELYEFHYDETWDEIENLIKQTIYDMNSWFKANDIDCRSKDLGIPKH